MRECVILEKTVVFRAMVLSETKPGVYYKVVVDCDEDGENDWCSCPAGTHGKTCKHVKYAKKMVMENG